MLERANHQHFLLEKTMVALCRENGLRTKTNQHIDVLAENDHESIIFEMKSSGPGATRAQIRRALSQLFEYRYLYRKSLRAKHFLCIVIERKPRGAQEWLIPYLLHSEWG
jgi:Fe2+ or Zn2+ uptake regulation protein